MKSEDIEFFIGQNVKLIKEDNFALYGTIEKVSGDSIFFRSKDRRSLIRIDTIKSIVGW